MNRHFYFMNLTLIGFGNLAFAGSVVIPNTFTAGDAAKASEVNANFVAIKDAVNDNDSRITSNTSSINTNTTNIASNTSAITTNTTNIATNTTNIATNTTNIATNTTNISTITTTLTSKVEFKKIKIVSPASGGAVESGTTLRSTMAAITDSSVSNPYVVFVEPGIYDFSGNYMTIKPYVQLVGSGGLTTIKDGALELKLGSSVRDLNLAATVPVYTTSSYGIISSASTGASGLIATISNITIDYSCSNVNCGDTFYFSDFTKIKLQNINLNSQANAVADSNPKYAVIISGGQLEIDDSTIKLVDGDALSGSILLSGGATLIAKNSILDGGSHVAIYDEGSPAAVVRLIATQLIGSFSPAGTDKCIASFGSTYTALSASCN